MTTPAVNRKTSSDITDPRRSRTPLGRRLRELRNDIVRSGEKLITRDEIAHEVAERRGEHDPDVR